MVFIFEAILVLAVAAFAIWLIGFVVRAIVAVAIVVTYLCLAALAGTLVSFLTNAIVANYNWADPEVAGILIGGMTFVGIFALLLRNARRSFDDSRSPPPVRVLDTQPQPVEEPQVPETEPSVRAAWDRVFEFVPSERGRVRTARASCAQLLTLAQGNVTDGRVIDCAALVRRNVPALVAHVEALWVDSDPAERVDLSTNLLTDLEKLAERSKIEVSRHRQVLHENLKIVRTHVANRTTETHCRL